MISPHTAHDGLVLLGCGKMGSAMLQGWLDQGMAPERVWVQDPAPSEWLQKTGVHINAALPEAPSIVLIAVKPQMMGDALPTLAAMGNGTTMFLSIAAGVTLARFEAILGAKTPIVRAMPNTPAAIGQGISALIGNAHATPQHLDDAKALLSAIGAVLTLTSEDQIDAVTAISGSGPAYVFYMIETMARAGEDLGLSAQMAMQLAKATVAGAGALAQTADDPPAILRQNVTSPKGTTEAGLAALMDPDNGLTPLITRTTKAAHKRSQELGRG